MAKHLKQNRFYVSTWASIFLFLSWTAPLFAESQITENQDSDKFRIVILGDSLTAGYGISEKRAFPALLEQKFKKDGKKVELVAAGRSGDTTAGGLSRLKWHLKKKPDLLMIALGGNDGLRSIPLENTKENLDKMISLAHSKGVDVLLAGMKIPKNYPKDYREGFEKIYEDLVEKHDVAFIPFLLKGVGGVDSLNLGDGIHPNEKGHKKIAEHVYPFMKDFVND
jgi:acyl-CoA thioesterase-1